MELENYHAFHFVGLGGVGMCALARILIEKGITVSGSDVSDSAVLQELRNKGAAVFIGHKREYKQCGCTGSFFSHWHG